MPGIDIMAIIKCASVMLSCAKYLQDAKYNNIYTEIMEEVRYVSDNPFRSAIECMKQASNCSNSANAMLCINNALNCFTQSLRMYDKYNSETFWNLAYRIILIDIAIESNFAVKRAICAISKDLSFLDSVKKMKEKKAQLEAEANNGLNKWRFICQSIALIFYLKREVNNTGIYMDKTLDIPVSITKTLTTFSKLIPEFGIVVLKHLGKIQCLWEDYLVIKQLDCPKYSNFEELSKFAATYSIAIPDYMRKL